MRARSEAPARSIVKLTLVDLHRRALPLPDNYVRKAGSEANTRETETYSLRLMLTIAGTVLGANMLDLVGAGSTVILIGIVLSALLSAFFTGGGPPMRRVASALVLTLIATTLTIAFILSVVVSERGAGLTAILTGIILAGLLSAFFTGEGPPMKRVEYASADELSPITPSSAWRAPTSPPVSATWRDGGMA